MGRTVVWVAAVVVLGYGAYRLLMPHADARKRDASGHCVLRARVYTFGEGVAQPRRVFGMQNLEDDPWTDVQVTVSGVVTSGPNANQPTGDYDQALPAYDAAVGPKKSREIPLDDFKSSAGPRWIPMTMRVTKAHVTAHIGLETCTYDTPVPEAEAR